MDSSFESDDSNRRHDVSKDLISLSKRLSRSHQTYNETQHTYYVQKEQNQIKDIIREDTFVPLEEFNNQLIPENDKDIITTERLENGTTLENGLIQSKQEQHNRLHNVVNRQNESKLKNVFENIENDTRIVHSSFAVSKILELIQRKERVKEISQDTDFCSGEVSKINHVKNKLQARTFEKKRRPLQLKINKNRTGKSKLAKSKSNKTSQLMLNDNNDNTNHLPNILSNGNAQCLTTSYKINESVEHKEMLSEKKNTQTVHFIEKQNEFMPDTTTSNENNMHNNNIEVNNSMEEDNNVVFECTKNNLSQDEQTSIKSFINDERENHDNNERNVQTDCLSLEMKDTEMPNCQTEEDTYEETNNSVKESEHPIPQELDKYQKRLIGDSDSQTVIDTTIKNVKTCANKIISADILFDELMKESKTKENYKTKTSKLRSKNNTNLSNVVRNVNAECSTTINKINAVIEDKETLPKIKKAKVVHFIEKQNEFMPDTTTSNENNMHNNNIEVNNSMEEDNNAVFECTKNNLSQDEQTSIKSFINDERENHDNNERNVQTDCLSLEMKDTEMPNCQTEEDTYEETNNSVKESEHPTPQELDKYQKRLIWDSDSQTVIDTTIKNEKTCANKIISADILFDELMKESKTKENYKTKTSRSKNKTNLSNVVSNVNAESSTTITKINAVIEDKETLPKIKKAKMVHFIEKQNEFIPDTNIIGNENNMDNNNMEINENVALECTRSENRSSDERNVQIDCLPQETNDKEISNAHVEESMQVDTYEEINNSITDPDHLTPEEFDGQTVIDTTIKDAEIRKESESKENYKTRTENGLNCLNTNKLELIRNLTVKLIDFNIYPQSIKAQNPLNIEKIQRKVDNKLINSVIESDKNNAIITKEIKNTTVDASAISPYFSGITSSKILKSNESRTNKNCHNRSFRKLLSLKDLSKMSEVEIDVNDSSITNDEKKLRCRDNKYDNFRNFSIKPENFMQNEKHKFIDTDTSKTNFDKVVEAQKKTTAENGLKFEDNTESNFNKNGITILQDITIPKSFNLLKKNDRTETHAANYRRKTNNVKDLPLTLEEDLAYIEKIMKETKNNKGIKVENKPKKKSLKNKKYFKMINDSSSLDTLIEVPKYTSLNKSNKGKRAKVKHIKSENENSTRLENNDNVKLEVKHEKYLDQINKKNMVSIIEKNKTVLKNLNKMEMAHTRLLQLNRKMQRNIQSILVDMEECM